MRRYWAQKHTNKPLGQWQHVIFCDESRFMLFRIDNRIRVRRLVGEAINKDLHMAMWLTEAVLYMYGAVSLIWENLLVRSGSDATGAVFRRVLEEHLVPHNKA